MFSKIQQIVNNCHYLLSEKKYGEGSLQSLVKKARPFDMYHLHHLGPIQSTKKELCAYIDNSRCI